jgi:hypothetical protein
MTSCVLLGGVEFLREHGQGLGSTLAELTGSVNERGTLLLLPVEELLLQVRNCAGYESKHAEGFDQCLL